MEAARQKIESRHQKIFNLSAYPAWTLLNCLVIYLIMACGGPPSSSNDISAANVLDLAHYFDQVSLDSSPMLPVKLTKPVPRNYSLRDLESKATIGTLNINIVAIACISVVL